MNSIEPNQIIQGQRNYVGRVMALLAIATIVALAVLVWPATAQTDRITGPRFQISSWGLSGPNRTGHGAYVLDTSTGEVWLIVEGGTPKKIAEKLK